MGQKESSTSTESSIAEKNETNTVPKERRPSQYSNSKRYSRDVELKNLDPSGQTSHKNKEKNEEESNLNSKKQHQRRKSKSVAVNLDTLGKTEHTHGKKRKERKVKSLEETSMRGSFHRDGSFDANKKKKSKVQGSKTLDQTKHRKKDLEVKFREDTNKPGMQPDNLNSDERRQSRRKSKTTDRRDSKSLGPTTEKKKHKSKARRAKSMNDISTPGRKLSSPESDEKAQPGQRPSKSYDPDRKASKENAELTIFNTYQALRLIDKQVERVTKNQECLVTLTKNIENFKNQVKTIKSSTTERRDKLWDKYEDWQKLIQGFDYPLAHVGGMMNVDMNFLKRLKFLDYVIVSMDNLKDSCRKLEKEKDISEAKHQEERKKLLHEKVKLENVQKRLEDMFPSIKTNMKKKERESHKANKGTKTESHYEASKALSNLLAQINTSFARIEQNFKQSSSSL